MRALAFWSLALAASLSLAAGAHAGMPAAGMIVAEAATEAAKANEAATTKQSAASGEAMVAPVKRVAPKTPVLSEPASSKKKTAVIVPSRPNCDPGFKVDDAGKACVRSTSGPVKSKTEKVSAKKKNR